MFANIEKSIEASSVFKVRVNLEKEKAEEIYDALMDGNIPLVRKYYEMNRQELASFEDYRYGAELLEDKEGITKWTKRNAGIIFFDEEIFGRHWIKTTQRLTHRLGPDSWADEKNQRRRG